MASGKPMALAARVHVERYAAAADMHMKTDRYTPDAICASLSGCNSFRFFRRQP